jgi:hypothetical protein
MVNTTTLAARDRLTVVVRRRAMRLTFLNGMIWGVGKGLVSTSLVVYLALDLHAEGHGLAIAWILAAPHLVGLLRLGAPAIIGRLAGRKAICLGCYVLSALTLLLMLKLAAPGYLAAEIASLRALVVLWCVGCLLQYLGTVAL